MAVCATNRSRRSKELAISSASSSQRPTKSWFSSRGSRWRPKKHAGIQCFGYFDDFRGVCAEQSHLVADEHPQAEATILGIEADDVRARYAIYINLQGREVPAIEA